tara:strand:+ start:729 stop:1307 length:579 start_codon:yes stop_codon:yes gene_type:complete
MRYLLIILSLTFLNAQWGVANYVDEFGDLTGNKFLSNTIFGKFSNSATTNSRLKVTFLVDKDKVSIQLYEYGSSLVKTGIDGYRVSIKYDGNVETFYGVPLVGDRLKITHNNAKKLINIIKENDNIKFHIDGYYKSEYDFTLTNNSKFNSIYNETFDNFDTSTIKKYKSFTGVLPESVEIIILSVLIILPFI